MARTTLTPTLAPKGYGTAGVAVTFTAWDATNGNQFLCTGKEVLVVQNSGVAPQTVTITSQADPYGRSGDITAESIAIGAFHVFQQFPQEGWADAGGMVHVDGSTVDIKFAVLRLP